MWVTLFLFVVVATATAAVTATAAAQDSRPVIAIFSQPSPVSSGEDYIAASYVKWVEAAGARSVHVPYLTSKTDIDSLVTTVNGFLFPGGSVDASDIVPYMYQKAMEVNDAGTYFPIWATCAGFEWTMQIFANDTNILSTFDAENISMPLIFTDAAKSSRLFGNAGDALMNIYQDQDPDTGSVTMNNHQGGVTPKDFQNNALLSAAFEVLSVNVDRANKAFVSTVEHKKYPFYASQWHPEKNQFEFSVNADGSPCEVIRHSENAILAGRYPATFFVDEARKNSNSFSSASDMISRLMYNFAPVYTNAPGYNAHLFTFVQCYFFKSASRVEQLLLK